MGVWGIRVSYVLGVMLVLMSLAYAGDVCIYRFYTSNSYQIIHDFLAQNTNFNIRYVDNLDFSNCSVLIVDQEDRNTKDPKFDVSAVANSINQYRPNVLLIKNAVHLYPVLTGKGHVCTRHWSPADHDEMGIVVFRNSTILRGWRIGQRIRTWTQFPGLDDDAKICDFTDGSDGQIISGFYTCYWGSCGNRTDRFTTAVYSDNSYNVLLMNNFRFLPEYNPSPESWTILKRSVECLMDGTCYEEQGTAAEIKRMTWGRDLIVEYSGKSCSNNSLSVLKVNSGNVNFSVNYFSDQGNGSYKFSVDPETDWVGNLSIEFSDRCGNNGNGFVFRNLSARSHLVFVTSADIRNMFKISVLGYPFISLGFSDRDAYWTKAFAKKYGARNVVCVDANSETCNWKTKIQDIYNIFPRNGTITIPPEPIGAYGAVLAEEQGKGVDFGYPQDYDMLVPCTGLDMDNCSPAGGFLEQIGSKPVANKYFIFNNTNLSAYAPLLFKYGYIPVFLRNASITNLGITFNRFDAYTDSSIDSVFMNTSVVFAGIEKFNSKDPLAGNPVKTYFPYLQKTDIQQISEITNPYHVVFPLFITPGQTAVIASAYGVPKFEDLLWTGMDSGFFLDAFLTSKGFRVTRIVEQRLDATDLLPLQGVYDYLNDDFFPQYFIDQILDYFGIKDFVYAGMTIKYTLLETNWKTALHGTPEKLPRLNNSLVAGKMNRSDIFFYFGAGNSTCLNLPPDRPASDRSLITNPYPGGDEIYPENISSWATFLFSPYSAEKFDSPFFVGYSGKNGPAEIVQTYALINTIMRNQPITTLQRKMYDMVLPYESGDDLITLIVNGAASLYNLPLIRQINSIVVRGLPEFKIDPEFNHTDNKKLENGKVVYDKQLKLNFSFENGNIVYSNVSGYLMDYGKPIVPYYFFKIVIPENATYDISADYSHGDLNETIVGQKNYTTYPLKHIYIKKQNATGNNEIFLISVFPVVYNSSGPDEYMTGFHLKIEANDMFGISWSYNNGVFSMTTSREAYARIGNYSLGHGTAFNITLGEGTYDVSVWDNSSIERFSVTLESVPEFDIMRFQKIDNPLFVYRSAGNYREFVEYNQTSDSIHVKYICPDFMYSSNITPDSKITIFQDPDGFLSVFQNSSSILFTAKTPNGIWHRLISSGVREWFSGRKDVGKDADRLIKSLESNQTRINRIVSKYLLTIK